MRIHHGGAKVGQDRVLGDDVVLLDSWLCVGWWDGLDFFEFYSGGLLGTW